MRDWRQSNPNRNYSHEPGGRSTSVYRDSVGYSERVDDSVSGNDLLASATEAAVSASGGDVTLIRAGSAFAFRAGALLVRVAPPGSTVGEIRHHAAVARWLHSHGVPAAIPIDDGREVTTTAARTWVVAAWQWVDHDATLEEPTVHGQLMAQMHITTGNVDGLPVLDPLAVTRHRIAHLDDQSTTPGERALLRRRLAQSESMWDDAIYGGAQSVVHGDFTGSNILVGPTGPVIIDFENAGVGCPTWDLVKLAHRPHRFAGRSAEQYRQLVDAYMAAGGPGDQQIADRLIAIADLIGATWTVTGRTVDPWFDAESVVRLAALDPASWGPAGPPLWTAH